MDNKIIFLIIGILAIILISQKQDIETLSLFPGKETSEMPVIPEKTAYTEGEELKLTLSNPRFINGDCGDGSVVASAIWIDEQKYQCNEAIRYGSSGELMYAFVCNTKDVPGGFSREGAPTNINTHTPPWGFDYGQAQLPKGLSPGSHVVEGYAIAHQGQGSSRCPADGAYATGYFKFNINVAYSGGVPTANTKIIKLNMKNTGSYPLYDITLQSQGTTPNKLYTAFSNLKQFTLEPNGQAVFYANLDVSDFNGAVPFQMLFNTRYNVNNETYSLTKFTEPLILNFQNGELI